MRCRNTLVDVQVVQSSSATESGYQILPLLGGLIVSAVASGQIVARTGRYKMLIFGALGPAGDEVREPEPPRRLSMLRGQPIRAADRLPAHLASLEVLADVVQVHADGGRVLASRPFPGGCVEPDLDARAVEGFAADQDAQ
jgi:hypothetical protein